MLFRSQKTSDSECTRLIPPSIHLESATRHFTHAHVKPSARSSFAINHSPGTCRPRGSELYAGKLGRKLHASWETRTMTTTFAAHRSHLIRCSDGWTALPYQLAGQGSNAKSGPLAQATDKVRANPKRHNWLDYCLVLCASMLALSCSGTT